MDDKVKETVMNQKIDLQETEIAGLSCKIALPPGYDASDQSYPVIYINGDIPLQEVIAETVRAGACRDFIMTAVIPGNWNDDFTPWGAPAIRKGEAPPKGKADQYIARLTEHIKPFMDSSYRTKPEPEHTTLLGYSLGGLAALYTVYQTELFGRAGCLSGSLWYDGFCEYMEQRRPAAESLKVYLSLGKKEPLTKNPRMAPVAVCTERAGKILTEQLGRENVWFEWNEGGHFCDIAKRFGRAAAWLGEGKG